MLRCVKVTSPTHMWQWRRNKSFLFKYQKYEGKKSDIKEKKKSRKVKYAHHSAAHISLLENITWKLVAFFPPLLFLFVLPLFFTNCFRFNFGFTDIVPLEMSYDFYGLIYIHYKNHSNGTIEINFKISTTIYIIMH